MLNECIRQYLGTISADVCETRVTSTRFSELLQCLPTLKIT